MNLEQQEDQHNGMLLKSLLIQSIKFYIILDKLKQPLFGRAMQVIVTPSILQPR